MSELDFAFFNLMPNDKRGLVYRKYLLDRLAPFLFAPRVARMIDLPVINARGYHVVLPLGAGNLNNMEPERRQQMLGRSIDVARDFNLPALAVDRRLKDQFPSPGVGLIFGDHFVKALAAAHIKRTLSKHDVKRIIIATDNEDLAEFMDYASRFGVPLSVQTYHPARYEPVAYQMMYEKGLAVSTSMFNPQSWERGDLVVVFDPQDRFMTLSSRSLFYLQLGNGSSNLAPALESSLSSCGVKACLHTLAPILELCLGPIAELPPAADGKGGTNHTRAFIALEKAAASLGLWELFLDKA